MKRAVGQLVSQSLTHSLEVARCTAPMRTNIIVAIPLGRTLVDLVLLEIRHYGHELKVVDLGVELRKVGGRVAQHLHLVLAVLAAVLLLEALRKVRQSHHGRLLVNVLAAIEVAPLIAVEAHAIVDREQARLRLVALDELRAHLLEVVKVARELVVSTMTTHAYMVS